MKKKSTIYLHGSKDVMYEKGESLGLTGEALKNFAYCCYEVELQIEVDTKTGKYKILSCKDID